MATLNDHTIVGNLGATAEVKYTQAGKLILSFSVATKEWVPNGQPETEWFNVSVFGKTAETLADLMMQNGALQKGDQVLVKGSTRLNTYTRQDGTTTASLRTNAREVVLLGSRNENQNAGGHQEAQQYAPAPPPLPGRR